MSLRPAFLLSLPRSGSTLLQRLIATHPKVDTTTEPWFLLPLVYSTRREGVSAEYNHPDAVKGLLDFASHLPDDLETYRARIREVALSLYTDVADPGSEWFLDKTPRYHLIVQDLIETFPEAKFILLSRNPLAIAASVVDRFGEGSWVIPRWEPYMRAGIDNLYSPDVMSRSLLVSYEELVVDPNGVTGRIHEHLGLEPLADPAEHFEEVILTGVHGDHSEHGTVVAPDPLEWVATYSNPLRKRWARDFIAWIGPERLNIMGYQAGELLEALRGAPRSLPGQLEDVERTVLWRLRRLFGKKLWAEALLVD